MSTFLAEGIGLLGAFFLLWSATRTLDRSLIIFQGIANALWTAHFLLLGGWAGAIASFMGLLRNVFVFTFPSRLAKWGYLVIFALVIGWQAKTLTAWHELLPTTAILLISFAVLFKQKKHPDGLFTDWERAFACVCLFSWLVCRNVKLHVNACFARLSF